MEKRIFITKPWHFWIVSFFALLVFSVGTYDFVNILLQNTSYLSQNYSKDGVAYFTDYPVLLLSLFAVNILFGLIGLLTAPVNTQIAKNFILTSALAGSLLMIITVGFMGRIERIGLAPTLQDAAVMIGTFALFYYYKLLANGSFKKEKATDS